MQNRRIPVASELFGHATDVRLPVTEEARGRPLMREDPNYEGGS
jgi:hypothetical protein